MMTTKASRLRTSFTIFILFSGYFVFRKKLQKSMSIYETRIRGMWRIFSKYQMFHGEKNLVGIFAAILSYA